MVAVPLAAVSGFGAVALDTSTGETVRSDHLWSLMHASTAAGGLICELQDERTMMALLLTGPDPRSSTDIQKQIEQTDAAVALFRRQVHALPRTPQATRDLLARIDQELTQLDALREQIRTGSAPALSSVVFQYRIAIADLAQFRDAVSNAGSAPQQIATRIHAANLLYQAAEATGQEEAEVLRSAGGPPLTPAVVTELARERQAYGDAMEAFDIQAPAEWHQRPNEAMTSPEVTTAQRFEDGVGRLTAGDPLQIDKVAWARSMSARRDTLDTVREDLDLSTLSAIAQLRDQPPRVAEAVAAAIAGTALLVVMISLRLGRPMIRGLRQLRDAAHAVAYERLPAAVEELRATESLTGRTPEEFADQAGDALTLGRRRPGGVRGPGAQDGRGPRRLGRRGPIHPEDPKDELAAVAGAFNSVHREAIRTAAEQVLLRAGVGATFVALARRGERLTGALTSELDRAERTEQDPDRLARLFVLDHLAARMTRNNESLLVLGGEGTARVRDRGVPLLDVVRAALGRIERYTRVDLETIDSGIVVAPQAVDHLVHLCAELLDNATAFSAPDSRITVETRRGEDRVLIQIVDRGIGMTPTRRAELNARLAAPRQVDSDTVRAMGLTVVAHLAAWYGIAVELRARPGGGTVAEVGLPLTVVAAPVDDGSFSGLDAEAARGGADGVLADGVLADGAQQPERSEPPVPDAPAAPAARSASNVSGHEGIVASVRIAATATAGPDAVFAPPVPLPAEPPAEALNGSPPEPTAELSTTTSTTTPTTTPAPTPATTTVNGLPVRVRQSRLPAEARRRPATSQESATDGPANHDDEYDPERVSATMAAYARGLTGRGGPKP
ncbi:MAG: nitrate- and nitrite sensing domain-containing protein [Catenulispora sp.]